MMNRTAETLFWIGRYLERAENHTRLIDVNYHMRDMLTDHEDVCKWERLIYSIGDIQLFKSHLDEATETNALQFLMFDPKNENSLSSCITQARNNLRTLRQLLPSELWDQINELYLWFNEQDIRTVMIQSPYLFFQRTKEGFSLFNGTAESTMLRDHTWNFIQAGKYFERAENVIRVVQNYLNFASCSKQNHYNQLIVLLKNAGGYEVFRKLYANNVSFDSVIEFLMTHPSFPHSVKFSFSAMEFYLNNIKHQDYQFQILADKVIDFVAEMKSIFTNLQYDHDFSVLFDLTNKMLEDTNRLGLDISKTFFQEEYATV